MFKIILGTMIVLTISACQTSPKHSSIKSPVTSIPAVEVVEKSGEKVAEKEEEKSDSVEETAPTAVSVPMGVSPKIGLILGPGALRAFAHVGVVQEFAKLKIPIQAIVGIEMGSLVAAIYANKGQPYDVEWQMLKLKESDLIQKSLLSSQVSPGDVKSLHEFMNLALSSAKAENSKIAYACPAFHLGKTQAYLMNRGSFTEMLPFCLAFPPLFKPYQQNIAGVLDLRSSVEYVRSKGANYVIYVDLLTGALPLQSAGMEDQVLWSLTGQALARSEKGLDFVLHVPLQDFDLLDFNHRREMIQSGRRAAIEALKQISKKLGL